MFWFVPPEPNLLVRAPVPADSGVEALRSSVVPVALPLERDEATGWRPHSLFRGRSANLGLLGCHASVLDPGCQPHPPHRHADEEVLLVLDGEAELELEAAGNREQTQRHRGRAGTFAYYPARFAHTIANTSDRPVTYLMFKWTGEGRGGSGMPFTLGRVDSPAGKAGEAEGRRIDAAVRRPGSRRR